jgi:hypothetical protein
MPWVFLLLLPATLHGLGPLQLVKTNSNRQNAYSHCDSSSKQSGTFFDTATLFVWFDCPVHVHW